MTVVYWCTYDGTMNHEQTQRLQAMLLHALAGDREAFDSAAAFGEVDREAADRLWQAGRLLALS